MNFTKLKPGDRVETVLGIQGTVMGMTEGAYPVQVWAPGIDSIDEAVSYTKNGEFLANPRSDNLSHLNLDFKVVEFREAMLALATDPKGKWTDLPEETFLEIAEAVRDYLLLPK